MQYNHSQQTTWLSRFSLRGDINGLILVLGVLFGLMFLPGPTAAECSPLLGVIKSGISPYVSW